MECLHTPMKLQFVSMPVQPSLVHVVYMEHGIGVMLCFLAHLKKQHASDQKV